jgi:hypothetical protein
MKKILALLFLLACALDASAQLFPYVYPSQIAPWMGHIRKAPCGVSAGDNCGSNPPTYHLTPDWCGVQVSTGAARNADGVTFSTRGDRYTLPTVAEFAAAGRASAAGAAGSTGTANREAQCTITFVMGAPGPSNYLRVGMDSNDPADKFTPFAQGAFDFNLGDVIFPYLTPGTITFYWDGVSWKADGGAPAILEVINQGQQSSHGNGRLFQVTTDPSWWTSGTLVGKLAWCPVNGRGLSGNANGGFQLTWMPANCVFKDNVTTASSTEWIVMRNVVSGVFTGITQGAAYGAGTAPNGEAYAAGNYPVLSTGSAINFASGNSIEIHNLRTTSGADYNAKWIGRLLASGDPGCVTGPCIELHERVDVGNGSGAAIAIGAPAASSAGDSLIPTGINVHFHYASLGTAGINTARITNPTNGVDIEATQLRDTIVGIARRTTAIGYQDSTTNRHVSSLFYPVEKECRGTTASDRTFTSTTFAEVNIDMRCNFVNLRGLSKRALELGSTGRAITYRVSVGAANGTAANGCEFAVSFDNAAAEPIVAGFVNPTGVSGGRQTVAFAGVKDSTTLTEDTQGNHFVTLHGRAVTGGTCTVFAASTFVVSVHWQ